jgi:D-alanyl-D-alanine carboxypeptidase (penicillin-binding protein 5/6)
MIARLGLCAGLGLIGGGILAIPFSGHDDRSVLVADTTTDGASPLTSSPPPTETDSTSSRTTTTTAPSAGGTDSSTSSTLTSTLTSTPSSTAGSTPSSTPATTSTGAGATTQNTVSPAPSIDSTAYLVVDATSGVRLAASNADAQRPIASIQKLLTAYVVMQAGELDRVVVVPKLAVVADESIIGLRQGDRYSRATLLRALLIVSAGDAASALAVDVAGSEEAFVAQMNAAAQALGLTDTVVLNPTGLDVDGQHSSAADVVKLAAVLMQDSNFKATVIRKSATLHGVVLPATNKLLSNYQGADGVKTGHTTQAGYCLVASANRDGREIIVVVLGATTDAARTASATALLDWGFAQPSA